LQEKKVLLKQLGGKQLPAETLHIPALDEHIAAATGKVTDKQDQAGILPALPEVDHADAEQMPQVDVLQGKTQRRIFGAVLFLGVFALCAVAGWLYLGMDTPVENKVALSASKQSISPDKVEPEVAPAAVEDDTQTGLTTRNSATQFADSASVGFQPESVVMPELPEVVAAVVPVVIDAPFRDGMKGAAKGPWMTKLPAGTYQMGSTGTSLNFDEGPPHEVSVAAFSISQHEVTFSEYDRFARATGRRLPYDETWGRRDRPVINVSWHDARAYTRWLSSQTGKTYRLPSEVEWEYAARGGSMEKFSWGIDSNELHANCFNCGSDWDGARTAPVGSFAANDFGLLDVAGNVQEWTADCYHGSYRGAPVDGSAWLFPECDMRVVRGGAYSSPLDSLRSAKRSRYNQDARLDNIGFRIVRAH